MGLLVGPVAGADHRAAGGVLEAHLERFGFEHLEGVGMDVAQHRQMAAGGLEVLADGEHLDVVGTHVAHHFEDFLVGFAKTNHQAGFGRDFGVAGLELLEQFQRVGVVGAGAGLLVEARDGFEVVVEDVGRGLVEDVQGDIHAAAEVGHQHFDAGLGAGCAGGLDALDEVLGAAVTQVVPVDAGDHHVVEAHRGDGLGEVGRFVGVEGLGAAVAHVAERAAAGADVAHDHEGGRALAEAFVDVGAGGFFAHGVELVLAQGVLDFVEAFGFHAGAELDADPLGLFEAFGGNDLDGDAGGLFGAALLAGGGIHVRPLVRWGRRRGSGAGGGREAVRRLRRGLQSRRSL